jgi:phosphorylated CTD-interacting factor 1
MQAKKRRITTAPLHDLLAVASTGEGAAAAAVPGRRARATHTELYDLSASPPPGLGSVCLRTVARNAAAAASLELLRATAIGKLRRMLHTLAVQNGLQAPPQLAFERWRFGCKLAEEAEAVKQPRKRPHAGAVDGTDSLLPCGAGDGGGLAADLQRAGVAVNGAAAAAEALLSASRAEAAAISRAAQRLASSGGDGGAQLSVSFHKHSLQLQSGAAFVTLQRGAYCKLVALFRMHGPAEEWPHAAPAAEDEATAAEAAQFEDGAAWASREQMHFRIFSLLLRYKTLHGAGFQAAAGPGVLSALRDALGVSFEAFASPMNARWAHHCSAFPDTDACFGSHGSFFQLRTLGAGAAIEVNPPFVSSLLDAAAERCLHLLHCAAEAGSALTMVYITPAWRELKGRAQLLASPYARLKLALAAADHGYVDGAAHGAGRVDPYRSSPYDSELLVMQSPAAAAARPLDGSELEGTLRAAFAQCVPSEAALRRQGRL